MSNEKPITTNDDIDRMLAKRTETRLSYGEPWPGLAADGSRIDAHVQIIVSVDHAIALMRKIYSELKRTVPDDRELLLDFISVNWAGEFKERTSEADLRDGA